MTQQERGPWDDFAASDRGPWEDFTPAPTAKTSGADILALAGAILGDPKPSPYRAPLIEKPVVPLSTPYNTAKNKPGRGLLLPGDVPRAQAMIESEARRTRAAQEQQTNADMERAFGTRSILGDTGESIGAAALRAPAIVGNLIKLPSTIYNAAGLPSDPRIGPDPLAVLGDALIAPADRANAARLPDLGIEDVGDALRPSVPMTLGERAATIGSAFQQGFTSSAADMAGAVIAPVPYAAGYTNQAATERANNDGRDSANLGDLGIGAADAAVQTFFERWATKRLFTGAPGIAPSGVTNTFKRIAKESGIQSATEFLEESFDYASTHYGTQKGGNFWDMVKQGLNGAFIGGPLGTAAQGAQEVFRGDPYESADRASLRNHIADRRTPQDQRLAAALELAQRGEWSNKALAQLGEAQTPMRTNIRANSEPEDRKRSNAIAPETLAAGNATLVTPQAPNAAPREPSQPAPVMQPLGDPAVAPEPTADLDALIAANLPPAAPAPANPSIEGAGVAATPDIDWNAAAAALGIDPGELGAAASSLFGDGTTPAPVLDVPRMDAELGAPAPVLDTARIASLLGLPSEQAQQQVAAPEPAAVAPPAKPQAPEVQYEPGLPEPSRFGPLDLRQEIGWSQRGGELVRAMPENQNQFQQDNPFMQDKGEVIGRTRWTGWPAPDGTESTFWRTRPDRTLTEKQANEALDKFERGEKLRPIEQRFIDHAKATAADYDRAMQLQEDAERGYSEVERQAALADMRAQHDIAVLEADSSEALSLYEIARRAAEQGVDDFDIAQAANESNQAYAARLWKLIEEADRGTDTGAAAEDRAGGNQGREGGAQRIQEQGFQLAQQSAPEARQADQVAPSAGLFGAPTTRDFIDAAKRGRDAARNGQTGTGRTDMLAGDGELFAGPRPQQADVEDAAQEKPEPVRAGVNAKADAQAAKQEAEDSRAIGEETADLLEIREAVDAAVGPGRVIYLHDHTGLPDRLRKGVESRMEKRGGKGRTAALYDPQTKQVYLFTDVVTDPKRAVWHVMHEIAGHHGLREFLGDRLDRALDMALQNPTVRAVADAIASERGIDMRTQSGRLLAAEEALAELAAAVRTENYREIERRYGVEVGEGIRARVAAAVENFLRRLKAALDDIFGNNAFTDEDVRALLENAWQAAQTDGEAGSAESVLESAEDSPVTAWAKQKFGDRIAPNGKPAWENFVEWFGDSAVVDADGRPLVFYHGGDPDFTGIRTGGRFSGAIFVRQGTPSNYGKEQHALYVKGPILDLAEMADMLSSNRGRVALEKAARRPLSDGEADLLTEALTDGSHYPTSEDVWALIGAIDEADAQLEMQKLRGAVANALGFQSVRTPDEFDGETVMILSPEQIKSATANAGNFSPNEGSILESVESFNESAYRPQVVAWAKSKFGDRAAPNGKPAWQNFVEWFGSSQVVNDKGEPLVVWHGSPDARFMDADATFMSLKDRYGEKEGVGAFWFAADSATARSYADDRRAFDYQNAEPAVISAYLKLENPLVVEGGGKEWREAQAIGKTTDVIEKAQAEGHDGVIILNVRDDYLGYGRGKSARATDTYVVFGSRQIKSATDNAGNFSPNEGSILESVEATPGFDAATATGAAVLRNGHLLSAIDAIKAAGGDLKAITDAVKARDGAALVRALDEALNAARPAPRVTGLKNAVTDAEREAAGRDPILKEAVKSNEATVYQAMRTVKNDPLAGPEAVARLESAGAEGISLADEAVMLVYKVELMNAREAASKVLADTSAGEAAKQAARQAWEEAEAKIAAVDAAAVNAGREWGRFGQFRQRMMREDFTLAALERKERARLERPLTAEESATVKAMADKIADLQAKYDALQARMANAESEAAYEGLEREMRRQPRHRPSLDNLRHAADAARRRLRETQGVPSRRGQSGAILSPAVFYDYAVVGAYHIANGAARFSDWVAAMRADIGDAFDRIKAEHPNIFKASQKELEKPIRSDATVAEVLEKIDPKNIKPSDVRKLAKAHIGEGLRGEPALIEALASDLSMAADEVRSLFVQSDTQREPTMSEAKQELQNLRKYTALQNEIDRLEAGIPKPPRAAPRPDSPAVAAKKAELAELRKKLRPVRDQEGRYQEMRGKQLQKRIDELKDRIARGDFATKPRVPRALSEANERLAFELDKAKEEFHRHQHLEMLKARSKWGKALGFVGDTFNLSRAVMTSVDLSGLLRQGGFVTLGRPVLGARAFFKTLPALLTEEAQHRIMGEIEARPNARLYRKYKLALTGSGGGPLAKVEEAYASRWLDRVALQADQPVRNAVRRARNLALAPTRGSGRVYAAFLSQLRADAFDAMVATMTRDGNPTDAELKHIADFVNTATGRAKIWGRVDNPGEIVNTLFFAPRLVASRFSLATTTPLLKSPSKAVAKLVAMEYARFLTGIAVTMSLLAYGLGDDDEAFADHFTFDPRSSDFMKLKFGDTRLDPFTGLSQVTVFTSRLFTGETVNGKGVLKPLRAKWTLTGLRRKLGEDIPAHEGITEEGKLGFGVRDSSSVLGSFLRTKMAPIPGAVVNLLNGTDFKGDPITLAQQARELMLPMSFGDIYDVMQDQGIPRGTAMSVLGLLGMSMQVQTQTDKQAFAEFTDRLKAVRTDVKDRLSKVPLDEWQSEFDAMKEEYGPVMDGMELQYYKKDGEYGKKGEPRRDKYGKAVIDMRLSDGDKYDDKKKGTQVNHLIPDSLVRHHPMMKLARDAGYDLDNPNNLLPMPDKPTEGEIYHKGDHPKYTATVFGALNAEQKRLKRKYGRMDKVPADELLDAVRKVEDDARKRIEAKDVPVKDGRLAGTAMGARATA